MEAYEDSKNIKRFKEAFWKPKSTIQVINGGDIHKIKSLKNRTAKFLEGSEIRVRGKRLKFFGGEKFVGYELEGTQSSCLFRLSNDEVPALEALYYALYEISERGGYMGLGSLVWSHIGGCKSLTKIF